MWKSIKQEFSVQRTLPLWGIGMTAGVWIVGMTAMLVITAVVKDSDKEAFCLGTVLALMFGGMLSVIGGARVICEGFHDAVYMGKTRKRFLPAAALVIFVSSLGSFALAGILCPMESALYARLLPTAMVEKGPEGYLTPLWILGYAMAVTGMACFFGGLNRANRKIGGIISFIVWMTMCWSIGGFDGKKDSDTVFNFFHELGYWVSRWYTALSFGMQLGVLALVGIVGYLIMYGLLIRHSAD